jgi:glutamine amidotransferase
MCRIFAFRSRVDLNVQRSLVKAENALQVQSRRHPHGWGISFYVQGADEPEVFRSLAPAWDDERFARLGGFLAAGAVLAHVRKATVGVRSLANTHPFQWGPWSFCHNGTLFGFDALRDRLRAEIDPDLRPSICGDTDSETLFLLLLTTLRRAGHDISRPGMPLPDDVEFVVGALFRRLRDLSRQTAADPREAMMNVVLTDGRSVLATRFNGGLSFSTQKVRCADRDVCPIADKVCFGPRRDGVKHTHVLIASDPTSPDDVWEDIPNHGFVSVDPELRLRVGRLPQLEGTPAWYAPEMPITGDVLPR